MKGVWEASALLRRLLKLKHSLSALSFPALSLYLSILYPKVSKDGDHFIVPLAVAKMSGLVKSMMEGACFSSSPFNEYLHVDHCASRSCAGLLLDLSIPGAHELLPVLFQFQLMLTKMNVEKLNSLSPT